MSIELDPHKAGVRHISIDIVERVVAREKLLKDFKRCLDTQICPKCGADLVVISDDDEHFMSYGYTCTYCDFKHNI